MAKLLYGSGLRLMECVRLRIKDIDFDRKRLKGLGKGDKWRSTILAPPVIPADVLTNGWSSPLLEMSCSADFSFPGDEHGNGPAVGNVGSAQLLFQSFFFQKRADNKIGGEDHLAKQRNVAVGADPP